MELYWLLTLFVGELKKLLPSFETKDKIPGKDKYEKEILSKLEKILEFCIANALESREVEYFEAYETR